MAKKKKSSKTKKKQGEENVVEASSEDRFDASKPQFREPHVKTTKVVLDERFASVLTDPKFQINVRDKYGRKAQKQQAKNELSAFYEIQQEEEEQTGHDDHDDSNNKELKNKKQQSSKEKAKKQPQNDTDESSSSSDDEDDEQAKLADPVSRIAYLTALSRGELDVSSSSDEESDDDDDQVHHKDDHSHSSNDEDGSVASEEEDDGVMGKAGILDPSTNQQEQVELTTAESPYLAVMNMDWSHVRAVDIFAVVSSFAAPGSVKRVQVYASDFGIERMEKEERFGPTNLWKRSSQRRADNEDVSDRDVSDSENEGTDEPHHFGGDFDQEAMDTDFDAEKLREYEASRLKYFFAIVEMADPSHADVVYKEVDGMEFEHSSAALDVRSIPVEELSNVTTDRPLRDEASSIPSNYEPPEFVVSALQQTNVQCTWEAGDRERERALTKYATSGQDWRDIAESDDIKAYLASDASSDDEEEESGKGKASQMRKMLGLDSDGESDKSGSNDQRSEDEKSVDGNADRSDSFLTFDDAGEGEKEVAFVPGAERLEDKIRSTIEKKKSGSAEPTPWEQYLEKKKQKRKERKAAARARREEINESRRESKGSKGEKKEKTKRSSDKTKREESKKAQAELELLAADGEGDDEEKRDFDMRGLQRIEQNKSKKLKGARKRKEAALEANVVGTDFKVDTEDSRFKAVLDGTDDRFGIDRTDPQYKETPGMREIMAEQTRRRKKRKTKLAQSVAPDVNAKSVDKSQGASALSSLVSRLKQKVTN